MLWAAFALALFGFFLGGTVALWLVGWTPDRAIQGSSPGRRHCVVFLDKTLYSSSASLHVGPVLGTCGLAFHLATTLRSDTEMMPGLPQLG